MKHTHTATMALIINKLTLATLLLTKGLIWALETCSDNGYSMYVWTEGFNASAPHCNGIYPINKDGGNATCFKHNWDTSAARQSIWSSCTQPGREVTRLFVSDMKSRIENNGYNSTGHCDADILTLLGEAHQLGIRIYALFAVSDEDFSESYMASYPGQFNANCGDDEIYFDGVAVNNEYFSNIKDCDDPVNIPLQQDHLDKLQLAVNNASAYSLPLHFSLSWNWDCCSCSSGSYTTRNLTWPALGGDTKSVISHMIDIVDSFDVQVAYIKNSTMVFRSAPAYSYWDSKPGKTNSSRAYVLSYTNPTDQCQTSYSPHIKGSDVVEDSCAFTTNPRTESGMYMGFDEVKSYHPLMKGSIHFMNGVYGSGITEGWPEHTMPFPIPYCTTKTPTSAPTSKPTFQICTIGPVHFVKIESTTTDPIQMFEVRAFDSGDNGFNGGIATQSSTLRDLSKFMASNAIDNDNSTFSHTDSTDSRPWWQVEMNQGIKIESVVIQNRYCGDASDPAHCLCRLSYANLTLRDDRGSVIMSRSLGNTCGKSLLYVDLCKPLSNAPQASRVKIQSLTDDPIQVFEVEVFSSGVNVAMGKTTRQSATFKSFSADRAVDGDYTSFSHTNVDSCSSWWEVDLGDIFSIDNIKISNRWCRNTSDLNNCLCRLSHASVSLWNAKEWVDTLLIDDMCGKLVWEHDFT